MTSATTHNKEYRLSRAIISSGKSLNEQIVLAVATVSPRVGNLISRVVTLYYFVVFHTQKMRHMKKQTNKNDPYIGIKAVNRNCPLRCWTYYTKTLISNLKYLHRNKRNYIKKLKKLL